MPIATIKNTAPGARGVHAADGLVMIEPGQTVTLDVPENELVDLPDHFAISDYTPADEAPAGDGLESMTVSALKALAAERGVALPETGSGDGGRVLKADIIAALSEAPAADADALDGMDDDALRATVQALTGAEPPADADRAALLALARAG